MIIKYRPFLYKIDIKANMCKKRFEKKNDSTQYCPFWRKVDIKEM